MCFVTYSELLESLRANTVPTARQKMTGLLSKKQATDFQPSGNASTQMTG